MANPYVNKVTVNGVSIIDLTADTVTPDKLATGYTAHSASGALVTGTMPTVTVSSAEPSGGNDGDIWIKI